MFLGKETRSATVTEAQSTYPEHRKTIIELLKSVREQESNKGRKRTYHRGGESERRSMPAADHSQHPDIGINIELDFEHPCAMLRDT